MSVSNEQPHPLATITPLTTTTEDLTMTTRQSPTLRRRRLSAILKAYREAAGVKTTGEVDKTLGWSPGKLAKMERGEWRLPSLRDMRDLLDLYGITDDPRRDEVLTLARQGRERGWWHPYREQLSEDYTTYIGLEAEATSLLVFEALVIPGLLQNEDYARALMEDGPGELDDEQIATRLKIRTERQKLLTADTDPLRLWAILDEAALDRAVGGDAVRKAQLHHIIELAKLPKVTIQVLPLAIGAHPGMSGPFTILEFPEPLDPDAVYTENIGGELLQEEPSDVARFKKAFQHLQGVALSPRDSVAMAAAKAGAKT